MHCLLDELEDVTEELPKRRRLGPLVRTPQPSKGKTAASPQAESQQKAASEPTVTSAKNDANQTSVSLMLEFEMLI